MARDDRARRLLDRPRRRLLHLHQRLHRVGVVVARGALAKDGLLERGLQDPALLRALRHARSRATRWRRTTRRPTTPRSGRCSRRAPARQVPTVDGGELADAGEARLVAWTTTPWTTLANVGLAVHPRHDLQAWSSTRRARASACSSATALEQAGAARRSTPRTASASRLDLRELPRSRASRARRFWACATTALFAVAARREPPTVRRFCDVASDVPGRGGARRLRDRERRHRPGAHRAALRRGRLPDRPDATGCRCILSVDAEGKIAAGAGLEPSPALVQGRRPPRSPATSRPARPAAPRRALPPQLPLLLALRPAAALLRDRSWFVRTTAARRSWSRTTDDRLASRARRRGALRQLARERRRLGAVAQALLGHAAADLALRRCAATRGDRLLRRAVRSAGQAAPGERLRPRAVRSRTGRSSTTSPGALRRAAAGTMRRVDDVIDAWYDSGAMPFAQHHYPFGTTAAALIRPGDGRAASRPTSSPRRSTRRAAGSTPCTCSAMLLFDVGGLPRTASCSATSTTSRAARCRKRLGNVVEPMAVIEETGADALRWYFCVNDPEQPSRFSARLVREAAQSFLMPLWNALSFFTIYANLDGWRPGAPASAAFARAAGARPLDPAAARRAGRAASTCALDGYDDRRAARAHRGVRRRPHQLVHPPQPRPLLGRARPSRTSGDKESAYQTLYEVLTTLARLLAPFTPFVAEVLHGHLVRSQRRRCAPASVHLEAWPERATPARDEPAPLEPRHERRAAHRARSAARRATRTNCKTRQPLAARRPLVAVGPRPWRPAGRALRSTWCATSSTSSEIRLPPSRGDFVHHEVRPNFRELGKRFGKRMPEVKAALDAADGDALAARARRRAAASRSSSTASRVELGADELEVRLIEKRGPGHRRATASCSSPSTPRSPPSWSPRAGRARSSTASRRRARTPSSTTPTASACAIARRRSWTQAIDRAPRLDRRRDAGRRASRRRSRRRSAGLDARRRRRHDFAFELDASRGCDHGRHLQGLRRPRHLPDRDRRGDRAERSAAPSGTCSTPSDLARGKTDRGRRATCARTSVPLAAGPGRGPARRGPRRASTSASPRRR